NSGGFYRTLTMALLEAGIDYKDEAAALDFCKKQKIEYTKEGHFILNGKDVTDHLHDDNVTANTSQVSANVEIRHYVNELMREITKIIVYPHLTWVLDPIISSASWFMKRANLESGCSRIAICPLLAAEETSIYSLGMIDTLGYPRASANLFCSLVSQGSTRVNTVLTRS
ncbi:MAG: (d)CMP kinase, partial [Selenomonas sp.]|nr:(d)CMP kinase [Selenomonas sp.]